MLSEKNNIETMCLSKNLLYFGLICYEKINNKKYRQRCAFYLFNRRKKNLNGIYINKNCFTHFISILNTNRSFLSFVTGNIYLRSSDEIVILALQ